MKLTRFREVAIHWSPETQANRSQDLDNPIWLLNCVSEMYSTALQLGRVSSKGVRKLNIFLGPNEDQTWDSQISGGIASIRLMDSLSTMNLRDGRAVNRHALDMIRQAVSMLVCNGVLQEADAISAGEFILKNGFAQKYAISKSIHFHAGSERSAKLVVGTYFDHVILSVQVWRGRRLERERALFKSWPSAELLAMSLVNVEVSATGSMTILLRDSVPSFLNVSRFGVSKISFDGLDAGQISRYEIDDKFARICVEFDISDLLGADDLGPC